MRPFTAFVHRVRSLLSLEGADRALNDEMAFHLEMETRRLVEAGVPVEQAHAEAVRAFGGVARHRDEARDARGIAVIEDFFTDLRLGWRGFRRQPGFSVVVVLTLGAGIGAITSVFGAVYNVILAPLPYDQASRVMVLWEHNLQSGAQRNETSPANFLDWRGRNRTFEHVAATEPFGFDYSEMGEPVSFNTALVTEGFFEVFRIPPILGRTLQSPDYAVGAEPVVVFSERLWRSRFGADSGIIGRTMLLDTLPRRVVGVMPDVFDLPHGEDVWAPKIIDGEQGELRAGNWFGVVGRLREGVTLEQANADLNRLSVDLAREYPRTNARARTWAEPIESALFGAVRGSLYTLLGAAAFVLAVVCANAGALIVTRTLQRDRELAVRAALGAGRSRLLRQLVAETAALATTGGLLGVILAIAGTAAIRRLAPADLPRVEAIGVSVPVLLFCAGVTALTCVMSALAAFGAVRRGARPLVAAPTTAGRRAQWARPILVGGESAIALVLVVGAGLLIRSFTALTNVDPGFSTDGVVTSVVQSWSYYTNGPARVAYGADAIGRLQRLPGVIAVGITSSLPLSPPIGLPTARVLPEGAPAGAEPTAYHAAAVAGDYFAAVRIPLRAGRLFRASDVAASTPVAVVSESFARAIAPAGTAIGRRVIFSFQSQPIAREIVGIVGDVRQRSLETDPIASVYVPHAQAPSGALMFVVRGMNPEALAPFVRRTLVELNARMPIEPTVPFSRYVGGAVRERRFHLSLLSAFAAVALGLAMLGIYGVTNQAATERTREIGLRVAVGATAGDIVRLILRQGAIIVGVGIVAGMGAAIGLTRLLSALLYGVTPLDPLTFALGISLLFILALVASWIPARRASAIDPVRALRAD